MNFSSRVFANNTPGGGPGEKEVGHGGGDPTTPYKIPLKKVVGLLLLSTAYAECILGRRLMLLRINGVPSAPPIGRLSPGTLCVMDWMERLVERGEGEFYAGVADAVDRVNGRVVRGLVM